MKNFKLDIELGNAAFEDYAGELSRILKELAEKLEQGSKEDGFVRDLNGNKVRHVQIHKIKKEGVVKYSLKHFLSLLTTNWREFSYSN